MEYRKLGDSGIKVSEVSLGGNNFGWWTDENESIKVINRALDLGINYIDTADMYGHGASEEYIGKAIKGTRSDIIIGSKFWSPTGESPNDRGSSRYYIIKAVEASLKRLNTDYIDLYQMHHFDLITPIEETLRALDDLVKSGKVRYIGCSNFQAWQLCEALWTSRTHNLHHFVTVQSRYSLLHRDLEKEVIPCCQAYNIGIIPWGPLAGGFLTGKYRKGKEAPSGARLTLPSPTSSGSYDGLLNEENWQKLARWEAFANEHGHTVGELAIAWLLAKPYVRTVIAGARTTEQISANVIAGEWKLTSDEVTEVDDLCPV